MATKKGQITSADDGTNIPDNNGFDVKGPFELLIANGTTISATLQRKTSQGNWVTQPDADSLSTITGAVSLYVTPPFGGLFRINVTTATGTWDWEVLEAR